MHPWKFSLCPLLGLMKGDDFILWSLASAGHNLKDNSIRIRKRWRADAHINCRHGLEKHGWMLWNCFTDIWKKTSRCSFYGLPYVKVQEWFHNVPLGKCLEEDNQMHTNTTNQVPTIIQQLVNKCLRGGKWMLLAIPCHELGQKW